MHDIELITAKNTAQIVPIKVLMNFVSYFEKSSVCIGILWCISRYIKRI